jgi:hypothetical protein
MKSGRRLVTDMQDRREKGETGRGFRGSGFLIVGGEGTEDFAEGIVTTGRGRRLPVEHSLFQLGRPPNCGGGARTFRRSF